MFNDEQKERLNQWNNVYGWSTEQCACAAQEDETLRRLLDVEMEANGISVEARAIRRQITGIEICHRQCMQNVDRLLSMIGEMKPSTILGCGSIDDQLVAELRDTLEAASAWVDGNTSKAGYLSDVLGERTLSKQWLVTCLCKTLATQLKDVTPDEPLPQPQWPVNQ
jgi:hypothetical protein